MTVEEATEIWDDAVEAMTRQLLSRVLTHDWRGVQGTISSPTLFIRAAIVIMPRFHPMVFCYN